MDSTGTEPEEYAELRPLGALERYSVVRSHLGIYTNVCVTATYQQKQAKETPLKSSLYRALAVLLADHPVLSAVPLGPDSLAPRFIRPPQIDLDEVVTIVKHQPSHGACELATTLNSLLEEQHNTPFHHGPPFRPFWRLHVLDDTASSSRFHACLCFHHSLLDTKSAVVFHEDLERLLSHPAPPSSPNVVQSPRTALLPSLEALHNINLSKTFLEKQKSPLAIPDNVWSGGLQSLPVRTRLSSFWISRSTMQALKQRCKEQQVSISAFMMAALAASFFHILPAQFTCLNGDCAVSIRHFLPQPVTSRSMGTYVGSFTEKYSRHASIWDDARRTKNTIDLAVTSGATDMPSGYLSYVPDMSVWLRGKIGMKRSAAWELSNIGTLRAAEDKERGRCEIASMIFSQSASACSGAVKVSVASGRDQRLGFSFSWQAGTVDDDLVEGVTAKLRDIFKQAANSVI